MPMTPREMIQLLQANGFVYVAKDVKKGLEQKILKDAGLK